MAERRPLTLVGGKIKELPQGDTLPPQGVNGVPVYVQQTDPLVASPYLWYKTDATGKVIDILKG
jgi:hypothetical protein